jgi:hypothetical protein
MRTRCHPTRSSSSPTTSPTSTPGRLAPYRSPRPPITPITSLRALVLTSAASSTMTGPPLPRVPAPRGGSARREAGHGSREAAPGAHQPRGHNVLHGQLLPPLLPLSGPLLQPTDLPAPILSSTVNGREHASVGSADPLCCPVPSRPCGRHGSGQREGHTSNAVAWPSGPPSLPPGSRMKHQTVSYVFPPPPPLWLYTSAHALSTTSRYPLLCCSFALALSLDYK